MTKRESKAHELYKVCQEVNDAHSTTLTEDEFVYVTLNGFGCLEGSTIKEMERQIKVIRASRA